MTVKVLMLDSVHIRSVPLLENGPVAISSAFARCPLVRYLRDVFFWGGGGYVTYQADVGNLNGVPS